MFKYDYETVFILNPVLSDDQMKDTVSKFKQVLVDNGADIINEEKWGLKKLAYTIQHKNTGFYSMFEYSGTTDLIDKLETEFRREESILRFLTIRLDKHAVAYNARRRNGEFNKKAKKEEAAS